MTNDITYTPFTGTDEQRVNFESLAADLGVLPRDYDGFSMKFYALAPDGHILEAHEGHPCGAVACMLGHASRNPALAALPGEDWRDYSFRLFTANDAEWDWCFSGWWYFVDDTPQGAAARIRLLLNKGLPSNRVAQLDGDAPLSYTVEAQA